jgi:hypothetical protein
MRCGTANERLWCIYVSRWGTTNFAAGRLRGYWATKQEEHFAAIKPEDNVLFVQAITCDLDTTPAGFPRVAKINDFRGIAECVVRGVITARYTATAQEGITAGFPFRFRYREVEAQSSVPINLTTFSPEVIDAIRSSAIRQGRPVLAQGHK